MENVSAGRWLCRGEHYLEQVVLIFLFFCFFVFLKAVEKTRKSDGKGIFLGEGGGEVVCRDLRGRWRGEKCSGAVEGAQNGFNMRNDWLTIPIVGTHPVQIDTPRIVPIDERVFFDALELIS